MRARWTEFGLKMTMFVTVIAFVIYDQGAMTMPIIEMALAFILSAQVIAITQANQVYEANGANEDSLGIFKVLGKINPAVQLVFVLGQIMVLSFFWPNFFYFMPIFTFDFYIGKLKHLLLLIVPMIILGSLIDLPVALVITITGISILTAYLHTSIQTAMNFETDAYQQIDQLSAVNNRFRQEQQHLIAVQDQQSEEQVRLERKRIVDEIHDILGHQLSSAVIQIGALEYMVKDGQAKESLGQVKDVLNTSMANIRAVIHAEHASTIQLDQELTRLTHDFTKAPIQFTYKNTRPLTNQDAHSILNIVREGLTNINKHSNATKVQLRFTENVDKWTLLLADNGQGISPDTSGGGIGIMNMEERVQQLGGKLHISTDNGFRIFITIPFKEDLNHENTTR